MNNSIALSNRVNFFLGMHLVLEVLLESAVSEPGIVVCLLSLFYEVLLQNLFFFYLVSSFP